MGKTDVWQGTLALMILKTLETLGPQHGYGIARRIEQTSGHKLLVNYGTLYPALLKLEQEGYIKSSWGVSDNNRKAKFYQLTRAGREAGRARSARVERDDRDSGPLPLARRGIVSCVRCVRGSCECGISFGAQGATMSFPPN